MAIAARTNHGTEYLYFLAGKAQLFLGKKTAPEGVNQKNLRRGIKLADKAFDKRLAKYLDEMQEYAAFLPKDEGADHLKKRVADLYAVLKAFDER